MVHNFVAHKLVYQCFFVYICTQILKIMAYEESICIWHFG